VWGDGAMALCWGGKGAPGELPYERVERGGREETEKARTRKASRRVEMSIRSLSGG